MLFFDRIRELSYWKICGLINKRHDILFLDKELVPNNSFDFILFI